MHPDYAHAQAIIDERIRAAAQARSRHDARNQRAERAARAKRRTRPPRHGLFRRGSGLMGGRRGEVA